MLRVNSLNYGIGIGIYLMTNLWRLGYFASIISHYKIIIIIIIIHFNVHNPVGR